MFLDEKVICPRCGMQSSLRAFRVSDEILELARLASRFGRNWDWVLQYLACFQSAPEKPLTPKKMLLLGNEVMEFVEKKGFYFEKARYSIRPDALFQALRQIALSDKKSFRNHNYFFRTAINMNQKLIEKDETEQLKKERELMERDRDPKGPERIKNILNTLLPAPPGR